MDFTPLLHFALHDSLHPFGGANLRKRNEMTENTPTKKDAAQTSDEAGATPTL